MAHRVLVVDDDAHVLRSLTRMLRSWGYDTEPQQDPRVAIERLSAQEFDVVLTDYSMPVLTGIDVLRAVVERQPACPVILLTAYHSIERAVEAMRIGAFHFLAKPFDNDHLQRIVEAAVARERPHDDGVRDVSPARMILGESAKTVELRKLILDIADSDSTVLVLGESGTGKELVARALHEGSRRRGRPFIPVHCGAIPESLLESEMFGHVKGAFTGATQAREGRFQLADGGTLFLDEIGEMPIVLQVKLLRALQERCFEPVGGSRTVKVDVRVLAATNRDLDARVADGLFRQDLYYRLNVIPLTVAPLRERREDIPALARHFLERHREARRSSVDDISSDALQCLMAHDWPGNVRELENLVERLVVLKRRGQIEVADLPERYRPTRGGTGAIISAPRPGAPVGAAGTTGATLPEVELPKDGIDLRGVLASYEERLIQQALERSGGNKNRAAALLGLNRTTLVEKLKRIPALRGQWFDTAPPEVESEGRGDDDTPPTGSGGTPGTNQ
jgi:DNA-binding NtrC family response regulator